MSPFLGEDESSQRLEEAVNSSEIQSVLSDGKYVCIKLVANSQEHLQFKQICKNVLNKIEDKARGFRLF